MSIKQTYDGDLVSVDYIYDAGESQTGIPPSVEIVAIWHKGVDISDIILEISTDWVARLEEKILQTKKLF